MVLSKQNVPAVRFALVALFVAALLLQFWLVPSVAAQAATQYPEYADLARPYVIAIGIAIGLFELALVAAWQVLSASTADNRPQRRNWATIFTFAIVLSGLMFAGIFVHVGSVARVGGPPVLFGLLAALAVVVFAVVLRRKTSELTVGDAEN
ncbi:DUF2975 domain-containing protein [Agromyces aureus]|uniref:DUF2975 domain-containing protein n=1 Tax=Agromyces aureus TaxID=453304 RepID=A0A191WAX6_9MICO|nr:DUF2975 domain-containing protein [Agromyces aureus]ANJ25416.1 hypothetical protein ATC03_00150 [Agromyces aureus]